MTKTIKCNPEIRAWLCIAKDGQTEVTTQEHTVEFYKQFGRTIVPLYAESQKGKREVLK